MNVTENDLERAAAQLKRSDKGRQAARDLLTFLQNGGVSLDSENQLACLVFLRGSWGSFPVTTREVLLEVVSP